MPTYAQVAAQLSEILWHASNTLNQAATVKADGLSMRDAHQLFNAIQTEIRRLDKLAMHLHAVANPSEQEFQTI